MSLKTYLQHASLCAAALLVAACTSSSPQAVTDRSVAGSDSDYPLYELRTYTTHDGKLDALHSRFRDHTRRLFEKHGIKNIAYWTPVDTPNTLVYIIAHKSKEAAANSWKAFVGDPEWQTVYAASKANGPLVANIESVFLTATDYSPQL